MALSFTQLQSLYGQLSQNQSSTNLALGAQLMNIEQRYLLQKYFANEGVFSITTVGSQSLTLTGAPILGAVTATLTSAWTYYTTIVQVTFSSGDIRSVRVEKGSTALTWDVGLSAAATTAITVGGLQFYPLPPNYSKLKTITITIGNLKWTPSEVQSRIEWDKLNVFPYYADIPDKFFIFPGGDHNGQIGIWPIPSTTGNIITFAYKFRVPDLSIADYTTGTVSVSNGSTVFTGSGTVWTPTTNPQNESRWVQVSETKGDNLWYQVASVDTATGITLYGQYNGITVSGGSYTLGQMPLIAEDFHDMLLWKVLAYYFTSKVDNKAKREEYQGYYDAKLKLLAEYSGTNTINVNLRRPMQGRNPNLYYQGS